jgi:hypothetical protein
MKKIGFGILVLIVILVAFFSLRSNGVLAPIALATNTPSLCGFIAGSLDVPAWSYQSSCYTKIAVKHNDATICNPIPDIYSSAIFNVRAGCYAQVALASRNTSVCSSLENLSDGCYFDYARQLPDPDVCLSVQNTHDKIFCLEYFRKDDTCYTISKDADRLQCFRLQAED